MAELNGLPASVADYVEGAAARFADRVAVVDPDGEAVTYRKLDSRAGRVAAYLASRGVGPGDRVALLMPKSAAAVAAILGILKTRAAYVPIDCTAPASRIRAILADCRTRALFVDASLAGTLEGCEFSPETVVTTGAGNSEGLADSLPGAIGWEEALNHSLPPVSPAGRSRKDLAYILYTSGSTGVPKGVMLSHGNALSFIDWCSAVFHPTEEDRFSSHAPFHFDLSVLDLWVSLKHGGSVHLIDNETGKNPKLLAALIGLRRLTVWYSTPSILRLLAAYGNLPRTDCSQLRLVLFAGEVFPVKYLRELTTLWPHPEYYNLYGPTETNVCTYARIPPRIPASRTAPYPIGQPCAHCEAAVLDAGGRPVARGEQGVLHIAGESVFQGYWNRPAENRAAFHMRAGARWYSTGDVVQEDLDEGLIYVGRRDRMVKRLGYRIELDDIERALHSHQGIQEAGVVAADDGGSQLKIGAYLVAGRESRPSILELKLFCARELPAYMSPDIFFFLDVLPRTSTSKVDYQTLTRLFRDRMREGVAAL